MKGKNMRCLLLIVLLVAILITAGCINGNQNTKVTPTQITDANSLDPIIGVWLLTVKNTTLTQIFAQEGSYILDSPTGSIIATGEWSKIQTNQYLVTTSINETLYFIFHHETDTLTEASLPNRTFYRAGKESTVSSPPISSSTYSSTSSSASPIHFSGSKPDTQGFAVSRGGGYIFTASYSGRDNFIVHVIDNNGEYVDGVFNAIGSYSGNSVIHLDPGKYYLEVMMAQGPWTIDMFPT